MDHLNEQKKRTESTTGTQTPNQVPNPNPNPQSGQLKSSGENLQSTSKNKPSEAVKKIAAKLDEKKKTAEKKGPGRPVGSGKKEPPEPERSASVESIISMAPAFVIVVYKQITDKLAEAWKADKLSKAQIDEFENALNEWIKLEEWKFDPLWMARIGVIITGLSPIVMMNPKFMEWLTGLMNAEQNNIGIRSEGTRKNDIRTTGDQNQKTSDSNRSPEGVPTGSNIRQLPIAQ